MASESEASCDEDPNFAVICAFFEKFGELLGVADIDICELQSLLENTHEEPKFLMDLHVKLLRKIKKSVHPERWEKSIVKFSHTFSTKDAWEIERFGYKKAKLSSKVRILKELLEAQFDLNTKFKIEINKFGSTELRSQPLGRDKFGHAYWFQSDDNYHIRVFKEDLDDEKWTVVARDRTELVSLISSLSDGDIKISSDSAGNEDSNSLSEKPIIDTGQQDTDSKKSSDDEKFNLERINQDDEDKSPSPKIKGLIDIMPGSKRPREDEEEESVLQKYKIKNLEIRVSKIEKEDKMEPVVGEAIEEPIMRIEGDGSGEDNESPIVGEVIEEDIMYFYGNGNGYDCQTGKQPEEEKQESVETNSAADGTKCTEENIPDSTAKAHESEESKDLTTKSPTKFFFGSGSSPFKSKTFSSTIAFGSTKKDDDENHVNSDKEINLDNKTVNINEPKASEEISTESETKSKSNETTELLEPKEKLQGSKKETDNVDNSIKGSDHKNEYNISEELKGTEDPVVEPLCVKKVAYVCGKDSEDKNDTRSKKDDVASITSVDESKTDKTVKDEEDAKTVTIEPVKPADTTQANIKTLDSVVTVKADKLADTTEADEKTATVVAAKIADKGDLKTPEENVRILDEEVLKKKSAENSLDCNDLRSKEDPLSTVGTDNEKEKPDMKSDSEPHPEKLENSNSNNDKEEVQPEVVFVSGRTRGKTQLNKASAEAPEKIVKAVKKTVKSRAEIKKKKMDALDKEKKDKDGEKSKVNSAESSIPNSPAVSLGDNSVISMGEITAGDGGNVGADDPLAVTEPEGDTKPAVVGPTVSSFSLDFADPPKPVKVPIVPSPMRAVRKRGREVTLPKTTEADNGPGKRMKLKGRRPVDTALRKSVEQRIEQLHGSSSESKDSEPEQHPKSKKKVSRLKKSATKKGRKKDASPGESDGKPKKAAEIKRDPAKKNSRILAGLDINEDSSSDRPVLRQSRRLAQLKIKEQIDPVLNAVNDEGIYAKKKSKKGSKFDKPEKRKRDKKGKEEEDSSEPEAIIETKKKKKKEKPVSQIFNENRPWQSSSEDSEEVAEEEEDDEEIAEDDCVPLGDLKSDHEFSPESDLEDDDEDYQPMKRARTAKKESDEEEADDFPCQKCGKQDHPEWILLCDKCDNGWHCSCLRPPLLVIPEGDWYCPPCQHVILLDQLQVKLVEYDKKLSKKEVEDRRKERLAYVGISLNNVLPSKEHVDHRKKKRRHSESGSNSSSSATDESESESDSDEPIYQLRQRRQTKNYKFNEYDEMIKTAIGEDENKPEDTAGNLGRGKDIQTIVKGLEPEPEAKKGEGQEERPTVTHLKKMLRKKHRKLNSLEFDSEEEDISDEDFKGSSGESEEEEDEEPDDSDDSDDYMGKKRRKNAPTRRSTRTRTKRYDTQFINDDSDDEPPKRKKNKSIWDETDTEGTDASDGSGGYGPKEKKKKKKKKRRDGSDDEPTIKKNRPRIKFGGLTSSEEEDLGKGRRTRGKRTTYVDTLGSDSEDEIETKKNPRRIESDDEDFVAHEEDEVEDDEKESDDKEERPEEEEDEDNSEQERREKRSLMVPKIYIQKPMGAKKQRELEAAKVKAANDISIKKPEENIDDGEANVGKIEGEESEVDKKSQTLANAKYIDIKNNEVDKNLEMYKPKFKEMSKDPECVRKSIESPFRSEREDTEDKVPDQPNMGLPSMGFSVSLTKIPGKRGRKPKVVHEPIVSNVNALFKNDDENDDLSEPPGISLPLFDDMTSNSSNSKDSSAPETPKKRRGRGPGKKKTLEESLSSIGTKISPVKAPQPAIEIAAPPQPFSQAQPTPSVITRMLQSKPGITIYPVGRIRPKQFATMRDDDSDESSPKNSPASSPAVAPPMSGLPNQYIAGGPRGPPPMVGPYRPHGPPHPGMNHYPRGPPGFRGPPPPQGMLPHPYSHHPSHRPMDPSPSGGGPINLTDPGPGPPPGPGGSMTGPGRESPGRPISRYPPVRQTSPSPILTAPPPSQPPYSPRPASGNCPLPPRQSYPPPSSSNNGLPPQQPYPSRPAVSNGPPTPAQQPYPPRPASNSGPPAATQPSYSPRPTSNNGPPASQPPEGYYGNFPTPSTEEPMPPASYQGVPPGASSPYTEQYSGDEQPPVIPPADATNAKVYDDETGGEFAGLASYFSSQRDDDLES